MSNSSLNKGISRRKLLSTTAAGAGLALAGSLAPRISFAAEKVVKIGFLAPLTGDVAAWGKPGLDGCQIWADWINKAGGIKIGGANHRVEFVSYDNEYDPGKARYQGPRGAAEGFFQLRLTGGF